MVPLWYIISTWIIIDISIIFYEEYCEIKVWYQCMHYGQQYFDVEYIDHNKINIILTNN